MSKEPVIETERLILRPLTLEDAEACFEWTSDERVNEFMSYPLHRDISVTKWWLTSTLTDENEWNWGFVLKSENRLIGSGGIGPAAKMDGYWGIGYNLHYDYWHKGYCTEAARAIIDFAHRELGVNKICGWHAADNPRSGKVMEKCGLVFDRDGEYSKLDGSRTYKAKFYKLDIK